MSANTEDFEKLRKLLKLKRYEQPPPGYFNHFSSIVINRIEREGESEGAWAQIPWLRKAFRMLETSPVFSGVFGAAVCGVVIFGITLASQGGAGRPLSNLSPINHAVDVSDADTSAAAFNGGVRSAGFASSTDPMFGSNVLGVSFASDGTPPGAEALNFSTSH